MHEWRILCLYFQWLLPANALPLGFEQMRVDLAVSVNFKCFVPQFMLNSARELFQLRRALRIKAVILFETSKQKERKALAFG